MNGQRQEATVKFYNADKGFGFLTRNGGKDIFFHISEWKEDGEPQGDEKVTFLEGSGNKGPVAQDVTFQ